MTKKRKSGGRAGGSKGSTGSISCSNCGTLVPKDKAKKKTGRITLVEPALAKELRAAGTYIAAQKTIVIDNSKFFRMDPNVPLIVPEVNPQDLKIGRASCRERV